jgi:mannose-1-phosphate guanylyltransferase/phosphomannomutase
MKALILAGGYATRLRPLSCEKPKLLFPIAGRPMLERTLNTLGRNDVSSVVLAVNFMADRLKKHFGTRHGKMRIRYSRELRPLGTGGPIKLAQRLLESGDTFLAMNGDILFEEDLSKMLERHKKERSIATIALHMVADASRFGLVRVDDAMRISSFVEKPKKQEPIKGLINAGIYLMSPAIFDYIPSGRKVSVEREVFPILAKEGKLLGYELKGYWTDIGKVDDYLEANFSILKTEFPDEPMVEKGAKVSDRAILIPPCLVMKKAMVGDGAVIGPFTVVGEGSMVEEDARIERSILFNDVHIGKFSMVLSSIMGDGTSVSRDVKLDEGTVLGAGVTVGPSLKLEGGVKVCPHKDVTEDVLGPVNICS